MASSSQRLSLTDSSYLITLTLKPVILVVEDDALLRLYAAGCSRKMVLAFEAANAHAALKLLETRDDVRLLFTDIQMPGSI